jgi:hypothetical protein
MVEITIEELAENPLTYFSRIQVGESFVVLKVTPIAGAGLDSPAYA